MSLTILVIEDEKNLARSIRGFLQVHGYDAAIAEDGEAGLALVEKSRPDLVFLDLRLPRLSGVEVLRRIKEVDPDIAVVVITAFGTVDGAVEAMKLGAADFLQKPLDLDQLRAVVARTAEYLRLRHELAYYRSRASTLHHVPLIGDSPPMQQVAWRIEQIAALSESAAAPTVLVTGETGTGKELVARSIHRLSARAAKPFVEVNCTALPASLMEAELFGFEKGAFTDAKESKIGLFEAADEGTLFLDEIGDLELPLQAKLLKAIEAKMVRRLGGLRDRKVDVAIVVATNRDLEALVAAGAFRADLYYRLKVLTLHLPPLRERGDDVLLLAEHFLELHAAKFGRKRVPALTERAAAELLAYPWPGNVRELAHLLERAVLWGRGDVIDVDDLTFGEHPRTRTAAPPPRSFELPPQGINLNDLEKNLIEQALRSAGGNRTRAARLLGVTRDILRYRIEKYQIGAAPSGVSSRSPT